MFLETIPARLHVGSISNLDHQPTEADARAIAEEWLTYWQESGKPGKYAETLPFTRGYGLPVFERDCGKTMYIILAGLDNDDNLVGYEMIKADIPGS